MYGKVGTWKGKKFTSKHKKNISVSLKGIKRDYNSGGGNPMARPVINLDTLEIFEAVKLSADKYNISRTILHKHLLGHTKTCCGCKWEYYDKTKEYNLPNVPNKIRNPKKKVYVKELEKNFNSATLASKAIGCSGSLVSKSCKKIKEDGYGLAKGYKVKYI